ncbi:hypothetical protein BJY20_001471 [Janibacter cremeus]|uniref:Uncharacterized protein n=1 Tax=Janibacter cremeus TaxID=1285192 RepID=A0A852VQ94_9MICO|nr:hypothetical protein [Janibacter cremeus]
MTKTKIMTAVAGLASGAAVLTVGANVSSQGAEPSPQAICSKATECMNQSLSGMAAQPGSAYRYGGGGRMYSIA